MTDKLILSFETSSNIGGTALADINGNILHQITLGERSRHGQGLAPSVGECLDSAGKTMEDIAGVAVDIGPGSYTGLRVGVMTAKAMAFGRGIPIFGICALDAIAFENRNLAEKIIVANTSRRDEVYVGQYNCTVNDAVRNGEVTAVSPLELQDFLLKIDSGFALIGSGAEQFEYGFIDKLSNLEIFDIEKNTPSPSAIAMLGAVEFDKNSKGENLHALQPMYTRRTGVTMPVLGEPVEKGA
jgi:tRNA threonylcarbamoyladenosine biosynthesis protein TsaB